MKNYRLNLSAQFIIAFVCLRHVFHEAHEFMHMVSAYLFTGVWGARDFNNVQPYAADTHPTFSQEVITSLAGPSFNYIICFIGAAVILKNEDVRKKSVGLVLIFAALPFARIFTAVMGGGDEFGVMKRMIESVTLAKWLNVASVLALFTYPLITAYKTLPGKRKWVAFVSFLFAPMILEGALVLALFNNLLKRADSVQLYWGTPTVAWLVLGVVTVVFFIFRKHIGTLMKSETAVKTKIQDAVLADA